MMQKNVRRLLIAAALSISGFITTITWYNLTDSSSANNSKNKPIARMVITFNEVQRKPIQKLIWQPVAENEILHIGEAIRTAADSEATIEFLNSPTRIDLDPDSAIILEENAGKIALNFLQGNLFVRSGGTGAAGEAGADGSTPGGKASEITLLSGNKKIAVGKSELSLGKSGSGELDLQVLKGQAQVEGADGKTVTLDQGKALGQQTFKLLAPSPDEMIYIDKNKSENVTFKWAPLTADYTVTLEVGPTRNAIKPVTGISGAGVGGQLEAPMKFGRNFYRLVARSTDAAKPELTTLIYKNEVVAITPPVLLEPEKDKKVVVNFETPQVHFSWSNPSQYEKVVYEIYRDSAMKQKMFNKVLDKNEINLDIKSNGQFYWRVAGQLKGRGELIYSELQAFSTEVFKGLSTPLLDKPLAGEKIPAESNGTATVSLTWQPVTKAKSYKVTIQPESNVPSAVSSQKALTFESEIPQYRTDSLKAGTYTWTVNALDGQGKASLAADKRTFEIVNLPIIQWADDFTPNNQYVTLKPTSDLKWQNPTVAYRTYKVRIVQQNEGSEAETSTQLTQQTKLQVELPKNGDYFVEVEALDSTNKIVARSARKKIEVQPAPLLPPPQFAQSVPARMTASNTGGAQIQWQKVDGATQYVIMLKNKDGVPSRELASSNDAADLRGLMPGEYKVTLKSIDKYGRSGPESEARDLTVPSTSGVKAPRLRGVKVK